MADLTVHHRRRLRDVWRSAGWPCRDPVEVELLAAGLLERHVDDQCRETLRVSDAGVAVLAATLEHNRRARDAHEDLVARVALQMHRSGRWVWRGLGLRAPLAALPRDAALAASEVSEAPEPAAATRWVVAMPDIFSVRNTTIEAYLEPVIHEIKVRRGDLLADVRRPDKRAAYLALAGECWYVLKDGIGGPDDVPTACGVMVATATACEIVRPAPKRDARLPFTTWMALARAARCDFGDDAPQAML
jgi:hypothetical protein